MTRKSAAIGAAAGALLAAGVVGITAAVLYLKICNQSELSLVQGPAQAIAHKLAAHVPDPGASPDAVQGFITRLMASDASVKLATVVLEPRSTKYRFLRKRRYLAHSDAPRAGNVLSKTHAEDKAIYDVAARARRSGALLDTRAEQDKPFSVTAAIPVKHQGKHVATAVVITEPKLPAPGTPAWPLGAGVVVVVLVGLFAGALFTRYRYVAVMIATAALALFSTVHLQKLTANYDHLRQVLFDVYRQLAQGDGGRPPALDEVYPALTSVGLWSLWAVTLLALGVGLMGHLGVGQRISRALSQHRHAYAYITPVAVAMLCLLFIPFGYGLALGFFNHAHGTYTFVGLSNFVEILSGGGRPLSHPLNFYFTLGVTILWTGVNVFLHVAIGLVLALVLKDPLLHFKGVYRVLLILPWAVPNYITALIWKGMFHHQYGAVNHVLSMVGVEEVSWFSSFSTAFMANVVTNTWLGFPFMMVVALGAMQSIPRDLYEAADVDGASKWQAFWRITLPLLRPAMFPAIVFGTIMTFNMFNIIYLVSEGAPGGSTDILITEAYRWAFERADRYGLASAYALITFFILVGYTLLANRMARATEDVLE